VGEIMRLRVSNTVGAVEEGGQPRESVARRGDADAIGLEHARQGIKHRGIVVDHQHRRSSWRRVLREILAFDVVRDCELRSPGTSSRRTPTSNVCAAATQTLTSDRLRSPYPPL
jgi:hypothetical protein